MPPRFHYLLVINREQASQTLFLKAVAKQWSGHSTLRGLLVHEDNLRSEQIIQNGVPRADAARQVAREINHRLIDLLAEVGLSAVGLQLEHIARFLDSQLFLDQEKISKVPQGTQVIVSNVVPPGTKPWELLPLAIEIARQLQIPAIIQLEHLSLQGIVVEKVRSQTSDLFDAALPESCKHLKWSIKEWEQAEILLNN